MSTGTVKANKVARKELVPPQIVGRITRKDGRQVFLVTSRSHPGALYRVEVLRSRLACGCPASIYTGSCSHRRVVHEYLKQEMAARETPQPPTLPDSREREPGILRREAFSLMK